VDVDAADVDEFGVAQGAAEGAEDFRGRDAELRREQGGLEAEVRARADLGDEPERDACALACAPGRGLDEFDLVGGIDVGRVDAGADGLVEFGVGFAGAVEDDLVGAEAGA
jgi:hypothetical protein